MSDELDLRSLEQASLVCYLYFLTYRSLLRFAFHYYIFIILILSHAVWLVLLKPFCLLLVKMNTIVQRIGENSLEVFFSSIKYKILQRQST